jgi:hypothetical protein
MSKELQVILTEQSVTGQSTKSLIEAFGAPFTEAGEILQTYQDIVVTDESQVDLMASAKEKRLTLKRIRTGVESKRKELKEDSLKTGRAIDSVARYIKDNIEPAEKYLELQEKFADIKKAEAAAKLKAKRIEELSQYTDDLSIYNLDGMEEETFAFLLAKLKKESEDALAARKAEAERIEKERLVEIERQKAIERENAKLKTDAEEQKKAMEAERKEAAEKQAVIDAARDKELADERAKIEALERVNREKEEAEARENARIEAEAKQAKEDAEETERATLLAPDKEKLKAFAAGLDIVRREKLPAVKTKQAQDVINQVELELSKLFNMIMDKAEKL